jgi:hypothetical protein
MASIEGLISDLGTEGFRAGLYGYLEHLAGADHVSLLRFGSDGRARLVCTASRPRWRFPQDGPARLSRTVPCPGPEPRGLRRAAAARRPGAASAPRAGAWRRLPPLLLRRRPPGRPPQRAVRRRRRRLCAQPLPRPRARRLRRGRGGAPARPGFAARRALRQARPPVPRAGRRCRRAGHRWTSLPAWRTCSAASAGASWRSPPACWPA